MKLCDFTIPEIKYLMEQANFTKEEEVLFNLRIRNLTLDECAEIMNMSMSTINRLSKRVQDKIKRVI